MQSPRHGICLTCDKEGQVCSTCGHCADDCNCVAVAPVFVAPVFVAPVSDGRITPVRDRRYNHTPVAAEFCGSIFWPKGQDEPPAPTGILMIETINRERRWYYRCDGDCHNSTGLCKCICGGAFHGITESSEAWDAAVRKYGPKLVAQFKCSSVNVSGLEREIAKLENRNSKLEGNIQSEKSA